MELERTVQIDLIGMQSCFVFDLTGGRIPDSPLNFLALWKRGDHDTLRWQLARERIGQLVRENYRANQEMSPRLAALIKKIENGSPEFSTNMLQVTGEKQND